MNTTRPRRPRLKLNTDAYRELRLEVLTRDGWHCQDCGSMRTLQVHHVHARSLQGDDHEDNLITLCARCHQARHA